jgi:sugar lactone lactonase YvrE
MGRPHAIERDARDVVGEGPMWSARENALYWVDILAPAVWRMSLADGAIRCWAMPEPIGWVIERANGPGLIAGFKSGFAGLTLNPFAITPFGSPEPDRPGNRLNDAKADPSGRIWAGSMNMAGEEETGALYRLDPDLTWRRMDAPYKITNGPTFSLDGRTLYHADTARRIVYKFAFNALGELSGKAVFVRFEDDWGYPDGMTTDCEGYVWIAHWGAGRVSRFSPEGYLDRVIRLPTPQITSCVFAGPDLDRMFITSAALDQHDDPLAGALFEVDPGVRGLPTQAFDG